MENTRLVLLHGAGLGAWIWDKVEPLLLLPAVSVNFPNRDSYKADHRMDLDTYCKAILHQISRWPREKIIIVAHSISGVVACRLSAELGERLVGFVGLSAVIPDNGGSFLSSFPFGHRTMSWLMMSVAGTRPPNSELQRSYCNDLTRADTDKILNGYVPESIMLYTQAANHDIPATIPKFYIKLSKDKSLSDDHQQRMIRHLDADRVATIDAGHLAMISEPEKVASVLNNFFEPASKPKAKQTLYPVHH